jgi:hypothetical protein
MNVALGVIRDVEIPEASKAMPKIEAFGPT